MQKQKPESHSGKRSRRIKAHAWPRHPQDWYVEPSRVTRQILAVERFDGVTLDPACGGGNIVKSFLEAGLACHGTDLVRRVGAEATWFARTFDFLHDDAIGLEDLAFDNIVMNPPFFRAKGAEGFIRRALDLAPRKVAAFVETRFLGSDGRANGLFSEFPPTAVWIVTPRPSCPPGDFLEAGNRAEGGKSDWCWIVWERGAPRRPTGWLRAEHATMPALTTSIALQAPNDRPIGVDTLDGGALDEQGNAPEGAQNFLQSISSS